MRRCLFCDETALTREHVWPDWISKTLFGPPKRERFTARRFIGPQRTPVGNSYKTSELNHKVRVVCPDCNHGWMSGLETAAQPILTPLMRGHRATLDVDAQTTIRAWVVLRAMVFEHGGSAPGARVFYTDVERRRFMESLEPLDGTYIWVFQIRSSRWVANSNVASLGLQMVRGGPQTNHLQVITAFVGRLGFQILVGRWPRRRRLELNSPAVFELKRALALLWPDPPADALDWPPHGFYLEDDTHILLLDRFNKNFPLQRRPRRLKN